ncbi:YhcN/YlaJ family sporulation lipoprotein [Cytobacillus firmus]|uniref:YhcN/YlaJ family sporulation lipoprotein n=2 Tax=Cytobacillus TaxID=2675230 RepID=A0A366JK34_CYTFI|nr:MULTISPECIES: YhcN/YlaJ family sporulation lipoprotein [Cytobacillus]RBP87604.1 YhcN/YlaJ family sporulation lipoprotein [Cytobacillus firmus]TDX39430.1 YhcN/YlaJ family sporulation lipoprotein [Cytobacillus oceanisediminis]
MKKVTYLALAFLPIPLLFGCAANQNNEAVDNGDNNGVRNVQYRQNDMNILDTRNGDDRNNDNKMKVADESADRISELKEVETANVIVTNRNAYVAVVLRDGAKGDVTDRLENKIADKVRGTDKDIQNVFVSSNPDFVERMKDYGNRINEGDPIEGLFDEFTETVRRVFPNAR